MVAIHEALVADFAASGDPIAPAGVRTLGLLESAVSRQRTGLGDRLKYPDPMSNAATLLYGICCDHPFHNGNKRTAVVAMLVHLDDNRLALYGTTQKELYGMVLAVAAHTIAVRQDPRRPDRTPARANSDQEVIAVASWIAERAARVRRGERQLTYRELRRILENFGFHLENPDGNSIDVVRHEQRRAGLLRKLQTVRKRIGSIGWPGEHEAVGVAEIKRIRRLCELTEAQGVDSDSFYDRAAVIDVFVNQYRTLLRRLARR